MFFFTLPWVLTANIAFSNCFFFLLMCGLPEPGFLQEANGSLLCSYWLSQRRNHQTRYGHGKKQGTQWFSLFLFCLNKVPHRPHSRKMLIKPILKGTHTQAFHRTQTISSKCHYWWFSTYSGLTFRVPSSGLYLSIQRIPIFKFSAGFSNCLQKTTWKCFTMMIHHMTPSLDIQWELPHTKHTICAGSL